VPSKRSKSQVIDEVLLTPKELLWAQARAAFARAQDVTHRMELRP
jgi:hypothetical protein